MAVKRGSLASERARTATGEASELRPEADCVSAKRKMAALVWLFPCRYLWRVSRRIHRNAETPSLWCEPFAEDGQANLRTRQPITPDGEILRLRT